MTERKVTTEQIDSINGAILLLQELFKTNNINANIAAAAMESYLDSILEAGLKAGNISRQEAEYLITSVYSGRMGMIKATVENK